MVHILKTVETILQQDITQYKKPKVKFLLTCLGFLCKRNDWCVMDS